LEFDATDSLAAIVPVPFVFLTTSELGRLQRNADHRWLFRDILPVLLESALNDDFLATINRCLKSLPPRNSISDIGIAFNRSPLSIRLNGAPFHPPDVTTFLRSIGWRGSPANYRKLDQLLADLTPLVRVIKPCIDISESLGDRVGLEFSIPPPQALLQSGWARIFDLLVEWQLCNAARREAVLSFIGLSMNGDCLGPWPQILTHAEQILANRYRAVIMRNISHLKLSCTASGSYEAKAYLFTVYAWRAPLTK
jgi:hypothetical protein